MDHPQYNMNKIIYRWIEPEIAAYQALNDPAKPLDSLIPSRVNQELVSIAQRIKEIVDTP